MINVIGTIKAPVEGNAYFAESNGDGLFMLISNIFKLLGVVAGIFFIVQIILAGYGYLSASGDPKKTEAAFAKIWQSLLGLVIVASAFVIAAFVGDILNINILEPEISGPTP